MEFSVSNTPTLPTAITMIAINAKTFANTTNTAPVAVINIPIPIFMQPTHAAVVLRKAYETLLARFPDSPFLKAAQTHHRLRGIPVHDMVLLCVVTHPTRVEIAAARRQDQAFLLVVAAGAGDVAHGLPLGLPFGLPFGLPLGLPLGRQDTGVCRLARDTHLARVAVEDAVGEADAAHVARRAVVGRR